MSVPVDLLNRFAFFQSLTPDELKRLARAMTRRVVPANTILFRQGDIGQEMFMVVAGTVEIYSGRRKFESRLNLLHSGDWFGELALIDGQPRSGSARTLAQTTLLTFPKADFRWLISAYPLSLYTLVATTQQRLRERDRAFDAEMRERVEQLERLLETALDVTRHLDLDKALDAIRERAVELLKSAGGEIYLYDEKSRTLIPRTSDGLETKSLRPGEGCTGIAFQSRKPVRAPHRSIRFELSAPILLTDRDGQERCLGALTVYRASDGAPYQSADETLLELFASQAAIVIENTELHKMRLAKERLDTELNDARRVQRSLIPAHPPQLRGYQVAALWYPAQQVAGDYYDFIPLPNGRTAFVIGDVSGKGLDSALFMANTRSILRASLIVGGTLADMIGYANTALCHDSQGGMFVTLFLGILDPAAHRFSYVNAGHNLPYFWRAETKTLQTLAGGNLALGILANATFTVKELPIASGDLIVMYTDGVTEATAANGSLFGEKRLARVIRQNAAQASLPDRSARAIIQELDEHVRQFTGAEPQSDDITVVAIRRA